MIQFAISTTAFRKKNIAEVIQIVSESGFGLEFSSGMPYREDMENIFYQAPLIRLPHNYFPAPKEPFVLNLASLGEDNWQRSVAHCKKGLQMAAKVSAPFFSAHAGFCVEVSPQHLGKAFPASQECFSREQYWKRFVGAVALLAREAHNLGVQFLVENNVVAPFNVAFDGTDSLLCATSHEMVRMLDEVDNSALGVLLDTGHLKVSALSLKFSADQFLDEIGPHIRAIHHSDNDGLADTNEPLSQAYWLLRYMPRFKNAWHILEVHDQSIAQIRDQYELLTQATME